MRIELTGKPPSLGPASPAHPESATPRADAAADQVDLSLLSRAAAASNPERLLEIQSSVRSGAYQVSADDLSHSIVDFYLIPAS